MEDLPLELIVKKILRTHVYDVAHETPISAAPQLSKRLTNTVLIKREDLQPVFSFKIRGAYNKISTLTNEEKERGIICASAGNHAQGVALSAQKLGITAVIVMPTITPDIKVNAVRARGATVVLKGDNFDEASKHCQQLIREKGCEHCATSAGTFVVAGEFNFRLFVRDRSIDWGPAAAAAVTRTLRHTTISRSLPARARLASRFSVSIRARSTTCSFRSVVAACWPASPPI